MTNLAMWSLVVGFVSPIILSIIVQPGWSSRAQAVVAFIWSLIAGGMTAYFGGALNTQDVVSCVLIVLVSAISFYKGFWKPTGIAPVVENATAIKKAPSVEGDD